MSDVWDVGFDLSGPAEVRVKAQEYTARVTDASIQELFKTKRLVLLFEPMECPEAGTVLKFICEIPGSTKGKRLPQDVGASSSYARAWIVANGGPPRRKAEESVTLKAPMDAPQDGTKPKNTFPLLWPRLLDVDGAAHYLSVSPWQVRRLVAEGHLRRVCLPGGNEEAQGCRRWLVDRFDLDELIDDAPKTTASMGKKS